MPEPTRRRHALAKVLDRWPDATASQIATSFGDYRVGRIGQAKTPGAYLRQLLEQEAEPGDIVRAPSKSTLHEDLKALRAESQDEKPSV